MNIKLNTIKLLLKWINTALTIASYCTHISSGLLRYVKSERMVMFSSQFQDYNVLKMLYPEDPLCMEIGF